MGLLLVAGLLGRPALAQSNGDVELEQRPAPFSDRAFRLEGTRTLPAWRVHVAVDLGYALRPLLLTDLSPSIQPQRHSTYSVVAHAVGAQLAFALGLTERLELAVALPVTALQLGEEPPHGLAAGSTGLASPRVGLKARLVGDGARGFGLAASVLAALPFTAGGPLTHEAGFGGEARLVADMKTGLWSAAVRAGYRLRSPAAYYDLHLDDELTYAAGLTIALGRRTEILGEIAGATPIAAPFSVASRRRSPLEGLVAVRRRYGAWSLLGGVGPGLIEGYGTPVLRAVAGLAWSNGPPDADRDGLADYADQCPTEPEDRDGFRDADGCPDPDNDADGVADRVDRCPEQPEDKDGFKDDDGCPEPDNDGDGIADGQDNCPNEPETRNGFEDTDGCPDRLPEIAPPDRDHDGLEDEQDECPDEPEDKDGFEDDDGCPDPDDDADGVADGQDKCPNEPETINGNDDEDGCPDKGSATVRIGNAELELMESVFFDTDRARVRHKFHAVLGEVAALLRAHPEIGRCAVEGHTDDTGPAEWNHRLSIRRAEAVIAFLVSRGVDRDRLVALGQAEKLPWASNATAEGRAKNRRVVFHIEGASAEHQAKQAERQRVRERRAARAAAARAAAKRAAAATAANPAPPNTKPAATASAKAAAPTQPAATKPPADNTKPAAPASAKPAAPTQPAAAKPPADNTKPAAPASAKPAAPTQPAAAKPAAEHAKPAVPPTTKPAVPAHAPASKPATAPAPTTPKPAAEPSAPEGKPAPPASAKHPAAPSGEKAAPPTPHGPPSPPADATEKPGHGGKPGAAAPPAAAPDEPATGPRDKKAAKPERPRSLRELLKLPPGRTDDGF